ncbi:MAG: UPF0104 family protein [Candidatus Hydrogenedentes bacterium]|nr:UPF0104 family protein [Candidatus Hydrogenedentota bacterium]
MTGRTTKSRHNWLGAVAVCVLLAVTVYSVQAVDRAEWQGALSYWRGHLWLFAVALGINYVGIACDFGAWSLVYRQFGVALPLRTRVPLFLAVFAGQFMPLQSARLLRPMLVRRVLPRAFGKSAAAEAALFYVDILALGAVICGLAISLVAPLAAVPAAVAVVCVGYAFAQVLFGRMRMLDGAIPSGFWFSRAIGAATLLRSMDWFLQGCILYLLLRPLVGEAAFAPAALSALVSTTLGAGTGLPGGIGATEGIMAWLVGLTAISAAHRMITVGAYRFITFYLQLPLGWICLVYLRTRARRGGRPTSAGLGQAMRENSVANP